MIYHITTNAEWQHALSNNGYTPQGFLQDGFVHCSDIWLLEEVANRYYRSQPDLVVLEIDPARTSFPLVYENLDGGTTLFPHLYGSPIPIAAVLSTFTFAANHAGAHKLPPEKELPMPALFTPIPFGKPAQLYRSVMPGSRLFDPQDEVLALYRQAGIQLVVVLTPFEDIDRYAVQDLFPRYQEAGLEVLHFPTPDFSAPPKGYWDKPIAQVEALMHTQTTLAMHCHAGIGRTGIFLACMAQDLLGMDAEESIRWVRGYIPGAVETPYQLQFVREYRA